MATGAENSLCSCGSGLPSVACCSLKMAGLRPAEPTPENQTRLEALRDARKQANQAAATDLSIVILTEQPTLLDALSTLFLIRRDQANRTAALALIRRAAALAPREPRYAKYLIEELGEQKAWRQAEASARRTVRLNPNSALAHLLLGQVFTQLFRYEEGEFHVRRALALGEVRAPETLMTLAGNLRIQGKFDEARDLFDEVLARAPSAPRALLGRAQTEHVAGNSAAAEELLNRLTPPGENVPPAVISLKAQIALASGRPQDALELLARVSQVAGAERHYLRGQALDKLARYDEAFAAFGSANAEHVTMAGQSFNAARPRAIARTSRLFVADEGNNGLPAIGKAFGSQPLFIVGSPRSGTTMLEQSLSMHPNIIGGGELSSLMHAAAASARLLGSPARYPLSLTELWIADGREQLSLLRDHYLNSAKAKLSDLTAPWFTDKALTHELYLGFIHLLFPQSPIIRIVRHPLDVVVSNYANALPHGGFKGGVRDTADYCKLLLETAEATRQRNPDINILEVRYEDILEDQEGWTRKMLDFVGEPFDEACLRFHENKRYGRTVSQHQVREQINNRSKYRYRNYLKHLNPAIEVLQSEISRLGYEI